MSLPRLPKPKRNEIPAGKVLCDYCTAKCCRYFALPIDTPTERNEYDTIRWFLLHDQASVFVDDGTWYLLVHTKCRNLRDDHLCGIYETRPQICRDYTTEACEYDDSWTYQQYFETPDQMYEYIEAIFPPPRDGSIRSPKPAGLPVLPMGVAR